MATQYGFYFDTERCIQCRTCEIACKSIRNLDAGVKLRQVIETWTGTYPTVHRAFFSLSCMHCEEPPCIDGCPELAIRKQAVDGIVIVDPDRCNGCRKCLAACPYHIPQFGLNGKMYLCDYCIGAASQPACTESCPTEALISGRLVELLEMAKGKNCYKLEGVAKPSVLVVSRPPSTLSFP